MSLSDDWEEFSPPETIREPHDDWPTFELDFAVELADDGREKCTVFPRNATDTDILTTWITADEEAFFELEEVR